MIGVLVAFPLNFLVRIVGKVARLDHSLEKDKKRIVVCKYKGMGSIIQSTPLVSSLRQKYPAAEIIYVSSIENKGVLSRIEIIDTCYFVDDRSVLKTIFSSVKLMFKLWKNKPDLYIDLEIYSSYSSIITTCSLANDRFGFYLNSSKYRLGLYTHLMYFNTDAPITEVYLQFARLLKCEDLSKDLYCFPESTVNDNHLVSEKYIVVNPNASDLRIERRWSKEKFVSLIQQIRKEFPVKKVVLIGSKGEASYVEMISGEFREDENVVDLSGKTSFTELIEVIRGAELVVTNDTGPMHLSASLKRKTIALFGPCSPQQYAMGDSIFPIYMDLYCSPCVHEFITPPCKGDNQCMKMIDVDIVMKKIREHETGELIQGNNRIKKYKGQEEELPLGLVER